MKGINHYDANAK